ncbi:carboxypeptidase-like regulatory domain-containing protein [Frigoriglobus tundricola]|uniref:Carboxypeptidase regulatory-like domain-containing protein n=1 Tax=Frigoriglobus tundricola TaxID=2774151 RepID=A0A6M5Z214_9BACT|nr:carboxypeptidase-like regulatory domain-containing protein [Frigoriglobus tundricola]QJX00440.1 hypothetical protein FTUN_8070 [Frigoriglobus tundricola]
MSRRSREAVRSACFVAGVALLAGGCASRTSTVGGTVTFRGRPVAGGSVVVYCADKQIARGIIGPDGTYTIPNVPSGTAIVTVQAPSRVPEGLQLKQNLPPSYGGPIAPAVGTAGAPRVAIPPRYALPEESGLSVSVDRGQVTYDIDLKP